MPYRLCTTRPLQVQVVSAAGSGFNGGGPIGNSQGQGEMAAANLGGLADNPQAQSQANAISPEQIQGVMAAVNGLVATGILNRGQGNALVVKLEAALRSLERGNLQAAANQLGAFQNQVASFVSSGVLPPEAAASLFGPQAVNDSATTDEDTPVTINVLANDSSWPGQVLQITGVSQGENGAAAVNPDGTITYLPGQDFFGSDFLTYTVADSQGRTATATVAITINPVNDPPVALDDQAVTAKDQSVIVDVLANDFDVDNDLLTITSVSSPAAQITPDNTVLYTPAQDFSGDDSFTYTISDGQGGYASATVFVTVIPGNDPPQAENDTATTDEDTPVTIAVLANDSDPEGQTLFLDGLETLPLYGAAVLNDDNTITYTPNTDWFGTDTFSYRISDEYGATSTATVTVVVNSVNDVPVAFHDAFTFHPLYLGLEPAVLTVESWERNLLSNDIDYDRHDPGYDGLLFVAGVDQSATMGQVAWSADGSFTYSPPTNFSGTTTFTYQVSDGLSLSAPAIVYLFVANEKPIAGNDFFRVHQGQELFGWVGQNDLDPDGDMVNYRVVNPPGDTQVFEFSPGGFFRFQAAPGFAGSVTFDYQVADGPFDSGLDPALATGRATIFVTNQPPLAQDFSYSVIHDRLLEGWLPWWSWQDPDSDFPLSWSLVDGPQHGTISLSTDGYFFYQPALGFAGPDSFTYQVNDGVADSGPGTVNIQVTNEPPVANDLVIADLVWGDFSNYYSFSTSLSLNGWDPDGDMPWAMPLSANDDHWTFDAGAGVLSFTTSQPGDYSFAYRLTDGLAFSAAAAVRLRLVAMPVWEEPPQPYPNLVAPLAGDDGSSGTHDRPQYISWQLNDLDADFYPGPLRVASFTQPAHGSVSLHEEQWYFIYQPDPGYVGPDSFTYSIRDGDPAGGLPVLTSNTATVRLEVTNQSPLAQDDILIMLHGQTPVSGRVGGFDSDPDWDVLRYSLLVGPAHGTLLPQADGTLLDQWGNFTYLPDPGFVGTDTIEYQVHDGTLGESGYATATVTMVVTNSQPVANDDTFFFYDYSPFDPGHDFILTANDQDAEGDALAIILLSQPTDGATVVGTVTLNNNGTIDPRDDYVTFIPNEFFKGRAEFTYKVQDCQPSLDGSAYTPLSESNVATVRIVVANQAPAAEDDVYYILTDDPYFTSPFPVLANDSDPEGHPMKAILLTHPTAGKLLQLENPQDPNSPEIAAFDTQGNFTYKLNSPYPGFDNYTYLGFDEKGFAKLAVVQVFKPFVNITAYRPQTDPFRLTEVPANTEDTIGAGIRFNGDDDNGNGIPDFADPVVFGENDLLPVGLDIDPRTVPVGTRYYLKRTNANIKVWESAIKGFNILDANNEQEITFTLGNSRLVWVEWVNPAFGPADVLLQLEARDGKTGAVLTSDSVRIFRFTSVVIVIGGLGQVPSDPPNLDQGVFEIGRQLYAEYGYDVHMYPETAQNTGFLNVAGRGAAYDEVVNAVNNRQVTSVVVFGFSFGGGATYNLIDRLVIDGGSGLIQPFAIPFTAYIDAIRHGFLAAGAAENRRPPSSQFHANYYQQIGSPGELIQNIMGSPVPGSNVELNVNDTGWGWLLVHTNIDDNIFVHYELRELLLAKVNQ